MPGHTLVIPKDRAEGLHDVDPVILGATIRVVQTVADAVKRAFEAPGIMIAQLNGPAAGQTVFHMHFHIMPRFRSLEFSCMPASWKISPYWKPMPVKFAPAFPRS